jgi:toxin ParE1/3/4
MKIVWTVQAIQDLLQIREYIGRENKRAAAKIARRLQTAAARLADHAEIGRPGRVGSTRELIVPGTPFLLPYRVRQGRVEILSVIHAAQEWPANFS